MICGHTTGNPDCEDRDCRRRWLTGSTTGEHYRPAHLVPLIADVLETFGRWFTEDQLWDEVHRLRPQVSLRVFRKADWKLRQRGGAVVAGEWVPVECRLYRADPFSTSTEEPNWLLRAR